MAHFAKLDENNVVVDIIRINDEDSAGGIFPDSESVGKEFISSLGLDGNWVQTSYNGSFRRKFAQPGFLFLSEPDIFVEPRPYPSWSLNSSYEWIAPVTKPEDGKHYLWNEESKNWDLDSAYHFEDEFID